MLLRGRIFMGIFTEMTHKHEINLGKVSNNCCIAKYRMNTYIWMGTNCMTWFYYRLIMLKKYFTIIVYLMVNHLGNNALLNKGQFHLLKDPGKVILFYNILPAVGIVSYMHLLYCFMKICKILWKKCTYLTSFYSYS